MPRRQRIAELVNLIVKGLSQQQLLHHESNTWGVSSEQAFRYIHEASDAVKVDLSDIDQLQLSKKVRGKKQLVTTNGVLVAYG